MPHKMLKLFLLTRLHLKSLPKGEQLAREFVKQQVEPKVDEAYQEGRRNIGANMPSVSEGKGSGTVYADYNSHGDSIDEMTKNAGIKK